MFALEKHSKFQIGCKFHWIACYATITEMFNIFFAVLRTHFFRRSLRYTFIPLVVAVFSRCVVVLECRWLDKYTVHGVGIRDKIETQTDWNKKCRYHVQLVFNLIFFRFRLFFLSTSSMSLANAFCWNVRVCDERKNAYDFSFSLCLLLMRSTQNYIQRPLLSSLVACWIRFERSLETDDQKFSIFGSGLLWNWILWVALKAAALDFVVHCSLLRLSRFESRRDINVSTDQTD